jgi:flavin reductase (DIM6/NTAB) family NADH-FMN oxidoreductase RutF
MSQPTKLPPAAETFRKALSHFATGVTVVTVADGRGHVHGMTANSFTSVSLEPLLVLVCVNRGARTHSLLLAQKRFGISILGEHQEELAKYFTQVEQDRETAKRLGVRFGHTERGTPVLEGTLAQFGCKLVSTTNGGDHTIFIGEVEQIGTTEGCPLIFHRGRYRRLPKDEP